MSPGGHTRSHPRAGLPGEAETGKLSYLSGSVQVASPWARPTWEMNTLKFIAEKVFRMLPLLSHHPRARPLASADLRRAAAKGLCRRRKRDARARGRQRPDEPIAAVPGKTRGGGVRAARSERRPGATVAFENSKAWGDDRKTFSAIILLGHFQVRFG